MKMKSGIHAFLGSTDAVLMNDSASLLLSPLGFISLLFYFCDRELSVFTLYFYLYHLIYYIIILYDIAGIINLLVLKSKRE